VSGERTSFLDYLDKVHGRTRRAAALVPRGELEWAPAADRFTFGDLIRHLAGIERWMYAETVHGRPSRYPGHHRALAEGLDATLAYHDALHAESRALFAELSDAQWEAKCLTPAGVAITTSKWLRLMVEHEAHHRGQLYLMLGLRGVAVPQLYGLTEGELLALSGAQTSNE
jgi:uncharacterized damage-inducible protein DinB